MGITGRQWQQPGITSKVVPVFLSTQEHKVLPVTQKSRNHRFKAGVGNLTLKHCAVPTQGVSVCGGCSRAWWLRVTCLTWMDSVSSKGSPQALLCPSGDTSGNYFKKWKKMPDRLRKRGEKSKRQSCRNLGHWGRRGRSCSWHGNRDSPTAHGRAHSGAGGNLLKEMWPVKRTPCRSSLVLKNSRLWKKHVKSVGKERLWTGHSCCSSSSLCHWGGGNEGMKLSLGRNAGVGARCFSFHPCLSPSNSV